MDDRPPIANYPVDRAAPDDSKGAWAKAGRSRVEALMAGGWHRAAQFLVGLTVQDATFFIQDDVDATKKAKFQATGISAGATRQFSFPNADMILTGEGNTATLTNKTFDSTDTSTQAALTTLTAGTSITLGATGATTQGSRVVVPTGGLIYAQINLTVTGAIAAGANIATLASGHRPPGTMYANLVRNALGGGTYTALPILIASGGQIQPLVALTNTDLVTGVVVFMTS